MNVEFNISTFQHSNISTFQRSNIQLSFFGVTVSVGRSRPASAYTRAAERTSEEQAQQHSSSSSPLEKPETGWRTGLASRGRACETMRSARTSARTFRRRSPLQCTLHPGSRHRVLLRSHVEMLNSTLAKVEMLSSTLAKVEKLTSNIEMLTSTFQC